MKIRKLMKHFIDANGYFSLIAWLLFALFQFTNSRFLRWWVVWNLSGYGFAFYFAPISLLACGYNILRIIFTKRDIPKVVYIVINLVCAAITGLMLYCCYHVPGTGAW